MIVFWFFKIRKMDNAFFFCIFNIVILFLVIIDLLFLSKNASIKKAIYLTFFWIFLGLSFSYFIYLQMGLDHFYEYLSAYFIEKSLSVDNIFVFLLIFNRLGIQREHQRTLLFAGIWGALILRFSMIFAVSGILDAFHFMTYIFGTFILFAGISSFFDKNKNDSFEKFQNFKKYFSVFEGDHNGRFFVRENGKWKITILVIAIFYIEISDLIFAFDSIPALFSITDNKTIIYTSNAFAIIGLRSLYIAFAVAVDKFRYLKYGVGVILSYIGIKMIFADYINISPLDSLLIISGVLFISFISSKFYLTKQER